ncbi:MAG: serine protease, partial [bacterium]
ANYCVSPYLARYSFFAKMPLIGNTTIINKTEEIYITENTAIEEAINKIDTCLVVAQVYKNNVLLNQGSGIITTNDGLIMTTVDLAPVGNYQYKIITSSGKIFEGKVVGRDNDNNLALIDIEADNLQVVSWGELNNLRLGQKIILIGAQIKQNYFYKFINTGTIRGFGQKTLAVNLDEFELSANGGPLVNIKGEVIGLNIVGDKGLIKIIPVDILKDFLSL